MKRSNDKKIILLLVVIVQTIGFVYAQPTNLLISNSRDEPGEVVNVKWLSSRIIYDEGVNLYRKEEGTPIWIKLNDKPIVKGDYIVPEYAYQNDSTLQSYIDLANEITPANLQGLTKVFTLLKSVYSGHFAKYLGIQYDDRTAICGVTYRYMIKKIVNGKEIFEAISEPVLVGPYEPIAPPQEVRVVAENKKVNMWWKVENLRFHSINIYRYSNVDTIPRKLNKDPIVLAERLGPDGKVSYPDVYFIDTKVNNDTNYFYSLAGIDFFGRESEYSAPVMASPRNRTPPPPAEMDAPKVNLLHVELTWFPGELKKVVGYHVYRTSSIYKPFERINNELLSKLAVRFEDDLDKPGNYYYYVATVDKNGNEGKSNMVMAEVLDIYPPPIPQNLIAIADSGQITLRWNSVEDEHLKGYRLYRTVDVSNESYYALLNAYPIEDTTYIDELPFNARNRFFYVVVSLDTSLNMSEYSLPASAVLPDVVPPDVPFIKEINDIDGALDITWLHNRDIDLKGYHVYRQEFIDSVPKITRINEDIVPAGKNSYTDIRVEPDVEYYYFLKAVDSVGNLSKASQLYPAMVASEDPVAKIELKNIDVRLNTTTNEVELKWQYINNNNVKGVVVFRRSSEGGALRPISGTLSDNTYIERAPKAGIKYYYVLVSYSHTGEKWSSGEYLFNLSEE